MYTFKIIKIQEYAEWQNTDPMKGAAQNISGSELKRRCFVEVSNGLTVIDNIELLVSEPFTPEKFAKIIAEYEASLPQRNDFEGVEARKEVDKIELYHKTGEKIALKEVIERIIKDPIVKG